MGAARKYPDELRDRAIRLVLDVVNDQEASVTAGCRKVGAELGINADTLRGWAKQAQVDRGLRPGTASADAARIRALERENAELRRVNAIGVSTVCRWLADGFIAGEQDAPGAPWRVRLTSELRAKVTGQAPDGWLPLRQAAAALGLARQTVLQKVQRGELAAVHVSHGRRSGLRIQVKADQPGLFEKP